MQFTGSLVVACMWDLVPWPGIEPGPPAWGGPLPPKPPGVRVLTTAPPEKSQGDVRYRRERRMLQKEQRVKGKDRPDHI